MCSLYKVSSRATSSSLLGQGSFSPSSEPGHPSGSSSRQPVIKADMQGAQAAGGRHQVHPSQQPVAAQPPRRQSLIQLAAACLAAAAAAVPPAAPAASTAPAEQRFSLEDVTPTIAPAQPLSSREQAVIDIVRPTQFSPASETRCMGLTCMVCMCSLIRLHQQW